MEGVSICLTLKNRAHLLKYCLESISRQDTKLDIEICVIDGFSTDGLIPLLDRYSDLFTIKYACADRTKSDIPILTNNPAKEHNLNVRWMASYDTVIKIDPEIVIKDPWTIQEIYDLVCADYNKHYNARAWFTNGDSWYSNYEDIIDNFYMHPMVESNEFFSRSQFYFCSGFSRTSFIKMGGIEELMVSGDGFDDTTWLSNWQNHYNNGGLIEVSGQCIHLWHSATPNHSSSLFELNRRKYELFKNRKQANSICLEEKSNGELSIIECTRNWANPEMLSTVYTIKDGKVINEEKITEDAISLDLSI